MEEQLLLSIIEGIKKTRGQYPGKKELQKTIYLLQKKGFPSEYSFRFHFYGPYSDSLDENIQRLAIQGVLEIQHDEQTHRIVPSPSRSNETNQSNSCTNEMDIALAALGNISARDMELMATIVFLIDNHIVSEPHSEASVIVNVHNVKKDKYSDMEIRRYYHLLKEHAYIQ